MRPRRTIGANRLGLILTAQILKKCLLPDISCAMIRISLTYQLPALLMPGLTVVSTVAQIRLPNLDTDCSRRPAPFSLPGVPTTFQEAMGAGAVLEGR